MDTLVRSSVTLLLEASIKSAVLLFAAGIVARGLRRASAASRHFVWLVALTGLLCLPLLTMALPGWRVTAPLHLLPGSRLVSIAAPRPTGVQPAVATDRSAAIPAMASADASRARTGDRRSPWPRRVLFVWLAGLALVVARMLGALLVAARLTRRAAPADGTELAAVAAGACAALGVRRPISLRLGLSPTDVVVPMTTGLRYPTVLLPIGARAWPVDRIRVVLIHELAHVKRGDWLAQILASLACAGYWFNPLAWWARHRLRVEAELASDDLVLAAGVKPSDYARHLWEIVSGLCAQPGLSASAVALAVRRELPARLQAIVGEGTSRAAVTRRAAVAAVVGALCLLGPVAALHPARMAPDEWNSRPRDPVGYLVATAPGYEYTFSGGLHLQLVAVAEPHVDGGRCWRPDGTLLTRLPVPPEVSEAREALSTWKRADHPLAFCFRLTSDEEEVAGDYVAYLIRPDNPGAPDARDTWSGHLAASPGGKGGITFFRAFRTRPTTCNFRLGVADGPWQTAATASYDPDRSALAAPGDVAFVIGEHPRLVYLDATRDEHNRVLPLETAVFGDVARRVVAVDRNGDTSSVEWLIKGAATIDGERALVIRGEALKGMREIRLQTRPYEWVVIPNVALRASDRRPTHSVPFPSAGRQRGGR
jgi:beta-lactamase regulating signal transducer with metallopeptidase domain